MREVLIAPQSEGKGRSFRATLLASVEADLLWSGGETVTDNQRPVWAMFAGSENELRAFMANLTSGRKATLPKNNGYRKKDDCLEFLKSSGYRVTWQKEDEGSIATIFLPDLFQIDPGMVNPTGITFIMLPTQEWQASQNLELGPLIRHAQRAGYHTLSEEQLAAWCPIAYLFAAYLDRRTRGPLLADGRFYLQLMLSCLKHELATTSTIADKHYYDSAFGQHTSKRYHEDGTLAVGLAPGLAFKSDHANVEKLMAHEVDLFFSLTKDPH